MLEDVIKQCEICEVVYPLEKLFNWGGGNSEVAICSTCIAEHEEELKELEANKSGQSLFTKCYHCSEQFYVDNLIECASSFEDGVVLICKDCLNDPLM